MSRTTTPPKEPGWYFYWYRDDLTHVAVVLLENDSGPLRQWSMDRRINPTPVQEIGGTWDGPLQPPGRMRAHENEKLPRRNALGIRKLPIQEEKIILHRVWDQYGLDGTLEVWCEVRMMIWLEDGRRFETVREIPMEQVGG